MKQNNKLKFLFKTFASTTIATIAPIAFLTSCANSQDTSEIKITFDAGEGIITSGSTFTKLPKDSKATFGSITKPTVSAQDKIFAGWTVAGETITDSTIVNKSLTVKANFVNSSGYYKTITFLSETGVYLTGNNVVAVKNNLPFFTVNRPIASKQNAKFKFWSTTSGGAELSDTTLITSNLSLYPVFANEITVTYGTPTSAPTGFTYLGPTSVVALEGDTFSTIGRPNPIATGYHFDGWFYNADCTTGQEVSETATFNSDITIYPKMTANV